MEALTVVVGHVEMSEQMLEIARRSEVAFRNPPDDDWEPDWDAIEESWARDDL